MSPHPLRLLLAGYGLAALVAAALAAQGAPFWAGALLFWLGGAFVVIALAVTPGLRGWFRVAPGSDAAADEAALAAALARWEEDRLIDAAPAPDSAWERG